jgi:hypothetical protein
MMNDIAARHRCRLGHRRKMLAAISQLTGATPVTSEPAAIEAQPKTQDSAERRQVTVMFSDLSPHCVTALGRRAASW